MTRTANHGAQMPPVELQKKKTVTLQDHEVIMVFQGLEAIWWDGSEQLQVRGLQRKLFKSQKGNKRLRDMLRLKFPEALLGVDHA